MAQTKMNKTAKVFLAAALIFVMALVMVFAILPQAAPTAYAASNISYIDENGSTKTAGANQITKNSNANAFTSGWYYVSGEVKMNIDYHLNIDGDVKIILVNGAYMHQYNPVHISAGSTLTIYGQTTGDNMGKMRVTDPYATTIDGEGTLVVRSGWLDVARTASGSPAITCDTQIYGGKTTVYGLTSTAIAGNVTLGNNMVVKAGDSSGSVSLVENYETNHGHRYAIISRKVNVSGLSFSNSSVNVNAGGDIIRYLPTVAPSNASYNELRYITWSSSNNSVATVNANGYVQPVAAGTTTITATANNGTATTSDDKKASYTVTVVNPTPVSYLAYNEEDRTFSTASCPAYQVLTNQRTWGTEGYTRWYVVESNQSLSKPMYTGSNLEPLINVVGDVRLIIKDGVRLAIDTHGIKIKSGASLTIYAQSTGSKMGELYSNGTTGEGAYPGWNPGNPGIDADSATLTINGCKVTGQAGRNDIGISCQYGGKLTINGGDVYAYARMGNIHAGLGDPECIGGINSTIVINGGKVTVDIPNDDWGYAIGCAPRWGYSNITINGGEVSAYSYHGSAFGGTLKIADDLYVKAGNNSGEARYTESYGGQKYAHVGKYVGATSLGLNQTTLDLKVRGASATLSPIFTPSDTTFNDNRFVTWTSSDESIATVDKNGVVRPVAPGTVTITAVANNGTESTDDDRTATCKVTVGVVNVSGVTLNNTTLTMVSNGAQARLSQTLSPAEVSYLEVVWSSNNESVVTVDRNGVITTHNIGTAVITCTATNGTPDNSSDDKKGTCTVTVTPANVISVALEPSAYYLSTKETLAIQAIVRPFDGFTRTVVWSSSDESVATVDKNGVVHPVSIGNVIITATATNETPDDPNDDRKATCAIEVSVFAEEIAVESGITLLQGSDRHTLTPVFTPADTTYQTVHWSSDNTTVATVDQNGVVTPYEPGTAIITVVADNGSPDDPSDDKTTTCTVTVTARGPVSYLDYVDGAFVEKQCEEYTILRPDSNVLKSGWYVVSRDVTIGGRITLDGIWSADVHILLMDGATLNANTGINVDYWDSLTVYAQTNDVATAGKLNARNGNDFAAAIGNDYDRYSETGSAGTIVLNGGVITAYGDAYAPAIGGRGSRVTINCPELYAEAYFRGWTAIQGTVTVDSRLAVTSGGAVQWDYAHNNDGRNNVRIFLPVDITGVRLDQTELQLYVSNPSVTLKPIFSPDDATYTPNEYLIWKSSDESVAKVDTTGVVSPVAPGTATISVTANNGTPNDPSDDVTSDVCVVTVGIVPVTEITLSQTTLSLEVPGWKQLSATCAPENASYKNLIWKSSDESVATVDARGIVIAVGDGTATISATAQNGTPDDESDDTTATCTVTVKTSYADVPCDYLIYNKDKKLFEKKTRTLYYDSLTADLTTWGDGVLESWIVADSDVTIDSRVTVNGTVHLILKDGVTVTANSGINVAKGSSLTIYAQSIYEETMGVLNATGENRTAGIGSNDGQPAGDIMIYGGVINARGGNYAAGIGGGQAGAGGTTIIYGGFVTAVGGGREQYTAGFPAGIGGGANAGESYGSAGGNIVINGGYVIANSNSDQGRAIGGGGQFFYDSAANYTVTLGNCMIVKERTPNRGDWRQSANVTIVSNHSYGGWTLVPPSNDKDGYLKRVCSVCGEAEIVYFDKYDCTEHQLVKVEEKDPTCAEKGNAYTYWHCEVCGYNFADAEGLHFLGEVESIPALPHTISEEWTLVLAPTCTEKGREARLCTVCGQELETREVASLGHIWSKWTEKPDDASKEIRTCSTCGEIETRDYLTNETIRIQGAQGWDTRFPGVEAVITCGGCMSGSIYIDSANGRTMTVTTIEKLIEKVVIHVSGGQDYSRAIRATVGTVNVTDNGATITVTGIYTNSVTFSMTMQQIYVNQVDVYFASVDGSLVKYSAVEPTCTEDGNLEYYYNTETKRYYSDAACTQEIERADAILAALGHHWTKWADNGDGTKTHTCRRCDATETRTILPSEESISLTGGSYSYSGQNVDIAAKGSEASTTYGIQMYYSGHYITATTKDGTRIDKVVLETNNYDANRITTNKGTRTVSGSTVTITDINSSSVSFSSTNTIYVSSITVYYLIPDGLEKVEAVDPTCTKTGNIAYWYDAYNDLYYSDDAGENEIERSATVVPKLAHELTHHDAKAPSCTETGWEAYDTCANCDYTTYRQIPATGHTEAEEWTVTKAATCTENGTRVKKCTVCGQELKTEEINALGHTVETFTVTKDPSCSEKGEESGTCTVCGEIITRELETIAHTWGKLTLPDDQGKVTHTCLVCGATETLDRPLFSETFRTDNYVRDCDGTYAHVNCGDPGDGGAWANYGAITVTAKDGRKIAKAIFYVALYTNNASSANSTKGSVSVANGGAMVIVSGINADSFEFRSSKTLTIASVEVCFEIDPETAVSKIEAVAPTCTEVGNIEYWYDEYNDMYFSDEACENEIDPADAVLAALGHDIIHHEAKESPSCTEGSYDAYDSCSRCDYTTYKEKSAPLGHTPSREWVVTKAPDCTESGSRYCLCTVCGETALVEELAPLGHKGKWTASETEEGKETRVCLRCGEVFTRDIPVLEENIDLDQDLYQYAGQCADIACPDGSDSDGSYMDEEGITITAKDGRRISKVVCIVGYHPENAETVISDKGVITILDNGETIVIENIDSDSFKLSSYTSIQIKSITLTYDFAKEGRKVEAVAPTCTEAGNIEYWYDAYDDMYFSDEACRNDIDYVDTILPALGHDLVHHDTKAPACTEVGWDAYDSCSRCDYTTYHEIAATGHTAGTVAEVVAPTCTERGYTVYYCSVCGETFKADYVKTIPHTPATEWSVIEEPTCEKKGVKAILCTECGAVLQTRSTSPLGHDLVHHDERKDPTCTETGYEPYDTCSRCDFTSKEDVPALGHIAGEFLRTVDPTCTERGYSVYSCSRCGEEMHEDFVDALGHTPGEWTTIKEPTCIEKGVKQRVCTVCGEVVETAEIETVAHTTPDEWEVTVPATCTEKGSKHKVCPICDKELEVAVIDALGHSYGEWEVTLAPTCTEEGSRHRVCSVCDNEETETVEALGHAFGDWTIKEEPSCTEKGIRYRICSVCGELEEEEVDALGHSFGDWEITKESDCAEHGSKHRVCSVCGEEEVEELPLTAHTRGEWQVAKEPTCIEKGSNHIVCTVCGEELEVEETATVAHTPAEEWEITKEATCTEKGSKHLVCTVCGEELDVLDVPELGHEWGEWTTTKAATETEEGSEERECTRCGEKESRYIPMAGHVHTIVFVEEKAATCTEDGNIAHYSCSVCGRLFVDEEGTSPLNNEDVPVPALGHDYHEEITDPTCTEAGHVIGSCSRCDYSLDEEIEALGHDLIHHGGREATCLESGYKPYDTCSRCDYTTYEEIEALGHNFGDWIVTTPATCTESGSRYHVCAVCGAEETEEIEALGHTAGEWITTVEPTCTEKGSKHTVCTVCGEELEVAEIDALGHDYQAVVTEPTCTERGYTTHTCTRCGDSYVDTYVDALGHTSGDWIVTKEPTCTEKGSKHKVCAVCGEELEVAEIDALGHDYQAVVTEPTCTERGYTTHTCTRCGDSYVDTYVDALGHQFGEWTVTSAPTCTEKGVETRVCAHDKTHVETRDVDALGHNFGEWVVTKEAQIGVKGEETRACSLCGEIETRPIAALPYVPTINGDGEKIYAETVTEEAKDVTELFAQAKEEEGSVEVKAEELTIVFDNNAVNAIGDSNVSLSAKIFTENLTVPNAELVLEVTLIGATFENGEAKVSIPFEKVVPQGKVAKVYYIADDGTRTDMKATFADGKVTFVTNHFSTYAVIFEDIPVGGLSGGAIAGIVIACVVVLIGAVLLILWLKKKKGNGKNDDGDNVDNNEADNSDRDIAVESAAMIVKSDDIPSNEATSVETTGAEDEAEDGGVVVDAKGNYFNIRYNKSFMAKLIQSSDETKAYYGELKNEALSYGKAKSRISWAYDSVNAGRSPVVKFGIRGKTLCVYFALDADDYADSKYKVEKAESAKYESVPCMYRIKNDRRLDYAKDLIAATCEKLGLTKGDVPTEDYRLPYETTEALVAKGLVKELTVAATSTQIERAKSEGTIRVVDHVSASEVNDLISNEVAASAIVTERRTERTGKRGTINVDVLATNFESGETVTIERLKEKKLIPASVGQVKLLARGNLDKVLHVELQDYSIEAVKMVIATGGTVKRV
ncbi:MAG: uL15 family ribosomal protein [Clostridia bacterium]|nr:uL15 family ribosomal protein [Clostridia bacterium]